MNRFWSIVMFVLVPSTSPLFAQDFQKPTGGYGAKNLSQRAYVAGATAKLVATPAPEWTRGRWSGNPSISESPTKIGMDHNKTVTAPFAETGYDDVIFDSNFDMGNLINVTFVSGDANGDRLYLGQQDHTTVSGMKDKHWWFYFSMDNIAGKNVTITIWKNEPPDFSTDPVNGNRWPNIEPVYSYDNVNWQRLPLSNVQFDRTACTYTMTVTAGTQSKIYLAPIPPYNISKRDALFTEFASSPYLTVTNLGTTPGGQKLKAATITDSTYDDSNKFKAYVTAQQHSGEVPASWNAEGMIRFLLSDDPTAQAIRRSYIFRIIPIVNVDGVYYGRSRYTPLRSGVQYDLNREWNEDVGSMQPEVRWIFQDIQAWHPDCFNDLHSTINTEQVSPKEALTYTWSLTNSALVTFMNKIRDGGWPETVRAVSSLAGGAFQNVHSRLSLNEAISFENPHNELSTAPGIKLTVNDWMNWGKGYAKGVYLYFGDASASLVNAKIFLQGPYNAGSMGTALNSAAYVPLTQPYSGEPWNYGGLERVASGFFASHSDIVDWVLVELRKTYNGASVGRRAAFIKNDGTIVDLDGTSPVVFTGKAAGNYYIVVRHRNHLEVMSASTVALSSSSSLYDFTTGSGQYFGGQDAAVDLGSGVWGMVGGNADNSDQVIFPSDAAAIRTDFLVGAYGYLNTDVDMDGAVLPSDYALCRINFLAGRSSQVP